MKGTRWKPKRGVVSGNMSNASKKKPVLDTMLPTGTWGDRYLLICSSVSCSAYPGRHSKINSAEGITSLACVLMWHNSPFNTSPLGVSMSKWCVHRSGCRVNKLTRWVGCAAKKPATTCPKLPPPQIHIFIYMVSFCRLSNAVISWSLSAWLRIEMRI